MCVKIKHFCHSGARPRNPGDVREMHVQNFFDDFYSPCSRLRGDDRKDVMTWVRKSSTGMTK